ncbi:MAG: PaaI family thioesterase [Rhodospirillaceae bacterium]|nr:PaaI family thioesterase [Rhodospirillaceae bacterium]
MTAVDVSKFPKFPNRQFLGGKEIAVDDTTGKAQMQYTIKPEHLNPVGTVFGGFLAGMIDDAASLGTWFAGGQRNFATASMTVNYLNPAKVGDVLLADITVAQSGARQAFVEVRITRPADGVVIALGSVVQSFLRAAEANFNKS